MLPVDRIYAFKTADAMKITVDGNATPRSCFMLLAGNLKIKNIWSQVEF
jgi:hypothetical protein